MPVEGTWTNPLTGKKIPDYSLTELLRELAGKRPSAEVTTRFNNPLVYSSQGISTAPQKDAFAEKTADPNAQQQAGGGYVPNTTTKPPTGGVDEVALANAARNNRINSYKAQAGNLRSQGQSTFDNILKSVNAFRDRSAGLRDSAGQEIVNRSSELLGSNARTGREVEGAARARGRAFGLGDSSKFNLQNKTAGDLAATQGATMARKGEQDLANTNLFQERQDQAQGQEDEANTYLRGVNDRATTIENTGYDAGEETFANSLNDIVNYQRQLAAIKADDGAGLTAMTPDFGGITNTINSVLSGLGGGQSNATEDYANPVNPTDVYSLLKRKGLVG